MSKKNDDRDDLKWTGGETSKAAEAERDPNRPGNATVAGVATGAIVGAVAVANAVMERWGR